MHIPDEKRRKLDSKAKKCVFIGYAQDRKGYKCHKPSTKNNWVSRDVVFDELGSWYAKPQVIVSDDVSTDHSYDTNNPQSTSMVGPTSSGASTVSPWSRRLRSSIDTSMSVRGRDKGKTRVNEIVSVPEFEVDMPPGPSNFGYDSFSNDSLDSELGIPSISTPGVKSVKSSRYVPPHERGESKKPMRKSQRVRYSVDRLTYSGFTAKHFAYMAKVVGHTEPSRFDDAVQDEQWRIAMDEKIDALALN